MCAIDNTVTRKTHSWHISPAHSNPAPGSGSVRHHERHRKSINKLNPRHQPLSIGFERLLYLARSRFELLHKGTNKLEAPFWVYRIPISLFPRRGGAVFRLCLLGPLRIPACSRPEDGKHILTHCRGVGTHKSKSNHILTLSLLHGH